MQYNGVIEDSVEHGSLRWEMRMVLVMLARFFFDLELRSLGSYFVADFEASCKSFR